MLETISTFISQQGLATLLVVAIGLFLWKVAIPAALKRMEKAESERAEREEEYRGHAENYRTFLLEEIKLLREDAKEDRAQMRQLIATLTHAVSIMDGDITKLYNILGEKRNLIQKEK